MAWELSDELKNMSKTIKNIARANYLSRRNPIRIMKMKMLKMSRVMKFLKDKETLMMTKILGRKEVFHNE